MASQLYDVKLEIDEGLPPSTVNREPTVSQTDTSLGHSEVLPPEAATVSMDGIFARQSRRVARNPCIYLLASLVVAIGLSAVGMIVGEFSVSANTGGWQSRGTLVANRETQAMIVNFHLEELFSGDDAVWDRLLNTVLPGWEDDDDDDATDDSNSGRRLEELALADTNTVENWKDYLIPKADRILLEDQTGRDLPFELTPRLLQDLEDNLQGRGCDTTWYTSGNITEEPRLWPLWKTTSSSTSVLSPGVLGDICHAESRTQAHLEAKGLCFGCDEGCLPPFSIVMYARLLVPDGWSLTCRELSEAWAPYQAQVEDEWTACVQNIKEVYDPNAGDLALPESCPPYFYPSLVEESFDTLGGKSQYTSSIFATQWTDIDALYEEAENFDTAESSSVVHGAYDTQYEDFNYIYVDDSLVTDMALAMGSALVVAIAVVLHTRSPFITMIGLLQIILSFPLSYFVYNLVIGLEFFPFLNFIGIFVVFALGAGDIFVAADKWKNARLDAPSATTEDIAAKALPDAAAAMFFTTLTTAVAFFATAICPVAPIKMFAIFCGLLIVFDYVMNILLIFPALCIYDRSIQANGIKGVNCFMLCSCFGLLRKKDVEDTAETLTKDLALVDDDDDLEATSRTLGASGRTSSPTPEEVRHSLVHRILSKFYDGLHAGRWPLFVACLTALGVCIYFTTQLELPTSSDVRLLNEDEQFEQNYLWRQKLLSNALDKAGGSQAYMFWGVKPDDTGDHNDPGTWSELVLDKSFDSSTPEAQVFLRDFCESMLDQDFAIPVDSNFTCPLTKFDDWLAAESVSGTPDTIYTDFCNGASGLPFESSEDWHACVSAWAQAEEETSILSRSNQVKIIFFPFTSRVRYDDHYSTLDDEWNLIEDWVDAQNKKAPKGVQKGYFTSYDFWWYDTNGQMLQTAYSAAGIALLCAAVVVLASSKSFTLTLFCTLTICYILTSVTATLVAIGWTLGFLESICFAILIGVSVDFCIHFAHAYATAAPGDHDRSLRVKYAVIHMGPSILATAVTTILSAVVMFFTVITFFQKFALILFLTVVQASIGSFIVFVVLADCFGPRNPTYLMDRVSAWWSSRRQRERE